MASTKQADLAGPGIGTYEEVEKILPTDYRALLDPKETQLATHALKRYIEDNLCKQLNLFHVEVPLIVSRESGVNDYLDRDGSRTPIEFPCGLGISPRLNGQVVQDNVEIAHGTNVSRNKPEHPTGPLLLQGDHGPVAFRNIKLTPLN